MFTLVAPRSIRPRLVNPFRPSRCFADLGFHCLDQNNSSLPSMRVKVSLARCSIPAQGTAWTHLLPSTASPREQNSVVETTGSLNPGRSSALIALSSSTYCAQVTPQPMVSSDGCAEAEMASGRGRTRKRKQSVGQSPVHCGSFFATKGLLKRHVDTQHISPGSFICPECGQRFNRRDNRSDHMRNVHRIYTSRRR